MERDTRAAVRDIEAQMEALEAQIAKMRVVLAQRDFPDVAMYGRMAASTLGIIQNIALNHIDD